jgi:hypothetical protein
LGGRVCVTTEVDRDFAGTPIDRNNAPAMASGVNTTELDLI